MTRLEYETLQERFRRKLNNHPYKLSDRKAEAYEAAVKACMSILSDEYKRGVCRNGNAGQ